MASTGSPHYISEADALRALQAMLDLISQEPGSIVYRGLNDWEAAIPERAGQLLVVQANGLPAFEDPA